MKLVLAVVHSDDFEGVVDRLREMSVSYTHLASTGGFLSGFRDTVLAAVPDADAPGVVDAIARRCSLPLAESEPTEGLTEEISRDAMQCGLLGGSAGGAVIFTLRLHRFIKM